MPSLKPLCAVVMVAFLTACAAPGGSGSLAGRVPESIPAPPGSEGSDDDGTLATQAQQATLEEALDNETRGWRNPRTRSFGTVTPLRTTHNGGCRDYRETVIQDGREASRVGTACKNSTGMWVVTRD